MNTYTLLTLLGTFCIGVVVGMALDDLIDRPIGKEGRSMKDRLSPLRARVSGRTVTLWLLIAVLVMNGAVGALLIRTRADADSLAQCVAAYEQQFSSAYRARFDSAAKASTALDRVVLAVADSDRNEFRLAIGNYVKLRQQAVADQKANPYPALPDTFCGKELGK